MNPQKMTNRRSHWMCSVRKDVLRIYFFLSKWSTIYKKITLHLNKLRKNIHKNKTTEITKPYNLYIIEKVRGQISTWKG